MTSDAKKTTEEDKAAAGDVPRRAGIPATKAVLGADEQQAAAEGKASPDAPVRTEPAPKAVLVADQPAVPGPFEGDERDKGTREAEVLGVDYQRAGQVRQMLAERANLVAYNNTDRLAALDEALRAAGYTGDLDAGAQGDPGPLGRATRADKQVHAAHPAGGPDVTDKPTGVGPTTAPAKPTAGKGVTSAFMSPEPSRSAGADTTAAKQKTEPGKPGTSSR
ncbi:MAG: hypothetical protein ACRDTZ_00985 [Pseudonocardiaceae bacterium]